MESKCLKCGSTDIIFPVETLADYETAKGLQLKLKEPKDLQAWVHIRDEVFFPLKARVCTICGFVEWYANPESLLKYWQRGYR